MESPLSDKKNTVRFPKLWVGYLIAASFLILEIFLGINYPANLEKFSLFFSGIFLVGLAYWFFCIYRIHKIISEATTSTYPISPAKAVGYHFIPFFNLYWIFRWPNEIADFVNDRLTTKSMVKGWPGFFLLLGMVLWQFDGALGLALTFTVGIYLVNELRQALGFIDVDHTSHWNQLKLAFRAGVGSACLMIFFYFFRDIGRKDAFTIFESLVGIFLAFIIIIAFLQPLVGLVRRLLNLAPEEESLPQQKRFLRVLAGAIVAATGILHGLLHEEIMSNPLGFCIVLLTTFILPGGITYGWTVGVKNRFWRAKWQGACLGFILGSLVLVLICKIFPENNICLSNRTEFLDYIIGNGLFWGFLGFVGGFAVDLGWSSRPILVFLVLFIAIIILNLSFYNDPNLPAFSRLIGWENPKSRMLLDVFKITGWGFGLLVDPHSRELLSASPKLTEPTV